MTAEGWYRDPFSQHEARWFSGGRPTALVRDGETEAQDAPPADTWDGELHLVPGDASPGAGAGLDHDDDQEFAPGRATDVESITGRDVQ